MILKKYLYKFFQIQSFKEKHLASITLIFVIFMVSLLIDLSNKSILLFLPLTISTICSAFATKWSIPKLKKFKLEQIIRTEGPQKHLNKAGTPSMGGIIVVPIGLIIGVLVNLNSGNLKQLIAISILSACFMTIGLIDDWLSISFQRNKGLTANKKIIFQSVIGLIFLIYVHLEGFLKPTVSLLQDNYINFGILIIPIALFILIAESNATNLTDGLDGLASGCGVIVFTGLSIELIMRGSQENHSFASFSIAMAGAWLGFLLFNRNPAKIFMGDTGSLAMGATLTGIALLSNTLWSLLIMGGIFLIESLSVIIQVITFKTTKKYKGKGFRVFRMAPIHHHLELQGEKEVAIVQKFWLVTAILIFFALMLRSNL